MIPALIILQVSYHIDFNCGPCQDTCCHYLDQHAAEYIDRLSVVSTMIVRG